MKKSDVQAVVDALAQILEARARPGDVIALTVENDGSGSISLRRPADSSPVGFFRGTDDLLKILSDEGVRVESEPAKPSATITYRIEGEVPAEHSVTGEAYWTTLGKTRSFDPCAFTGRDEAAALVRSLRAAGHTVRLVRVSEEVVSEQSEGKR